MKTSIRKSMQKFLNLLKPAKALVFAAAALAATALQATSYVDAGGNPAEENATAITSSTTTLETGWYVVEGTVAINSTVTVSGDVNLILADGAKLTVTGASYYPGISVVDDGETINSLAIYCQSGGTGELTANGGFFAAGIGGDDSNNKNCGAITIYGGKVTATGSYGAGIGGAEGGGSGGTVAIYGGTVTATDGSGSGSGIGKGAWSSSASNGSLIVGDGLAVLAGASEATAVLLDRNQETGAVELSGQKWFFVGPPSLKQATSSFTVYSGTVSSSLNVDLSTTIRGGTGTYTFAVKEGSSLPEWLTLSSGTTLTGTPTEAGTPSFTLLVEDTSEPKLTLEATYTVTVRDRYSITYKDGESTLSSLYPTTYIRGTGKRDRRSDVAGANQGGP